MPEPEVSFNYLGQLDLAVSGASLLRPSAEPSGPARSPRGERRHLLQVHGAVVGGRLETHWIFSEKIHRRATVEKLAQHFLAALTALIEHCRSPAAGGHTPADFPAVKLDQRRLDKILKQVHGSQMEDAG
jgi:non-ribosomal peptide synthase protein (TIGR01720 family)